MSQADQIYKMSFASIYPLYISKAEKKGRTNSEVDQIICWLTGYSKNELNNQIQNNNTMNLNIINNMINDRNQHMERLYHTFL